MNINTKEWQNISVNDMELLIRTRDKNPILFNRIMDLLQIVHQPKAGTADDVEFSVINNLRNMGMDALTSWSIERSEKETEEILKQNSEFKRAGKKKSTGKQLTEK